MGKINRALVFKAAKRSQIFYTASTKEGSII
jgi:hypothetical protein